MEYLSRRWQEPESRAALAAALTAAAAAVTGHMEWETLALTLIGAAATFLFGARK